MAIELFQGVVDRLHAAVETAYPFHGITLEEMKPYYGAGDYSSYLFDLSALHEFTNEFTAALIILAAEEELDDYPMEAVSE